MSLVRDRCVCLRKIEYSETSQILQLFAREQGLMRVIAKGAHRKTKAGASKFGGGIDLLDLGDAVFTHDPGREMGTLTEWDLREGHLELRRNLRGMYLGQYAAELLSLLVEEHDPHPHLFDRLRQSLLELGTPRQEEAFLALQLDLLREAGYLAELDRCVCCGAQGQGALAWFSAAQGGAICRNCEASVPDRAGVDPRLLRLMQQVLDLPRTNGSAHRLPKLTRHQTDPINSLFASQIEHMLGRRLRLKAYILPPARGRERM